MTYALSTTPTLRTSLLLGLCLAFAGCGDDEAGGTSCESAAAAGDVVSGNATCDTPLVVALGTGGTQTVTTSVDGDVLRWLNVTGCPGGTFSVTSLDGISTTTWDVPENVLPECGVMSPRNVEGFLGQSDVLRAAGSIPVTYTIPTRGAALLAVKGPDSSSCGDRDIEITLACQASNECAQPGVIEFTDIPAAMGFQNGEPPFTWGVPTGGGARAQEVAVCTGDRLAIAPPNDSAQLAVTQPGDALPTDDDYRTAGTDYSVIAEQDGSYYVFTRNEDGTCVSGAGEIGVFSGSGRSYSPLSPTQLDLRGGPDLPLNPLTSSYLDLQNAKRWLGVSSAFDVRIQTDAPSIVVSIGQIDASGDASCSPGAPCDEVIEIDPETGEAVIQVISGGAYLWASAGRAERDANGVFTTCPIVNFRVFELDATPEP
ncbi:MAG: hypothetical protein ACI81R_002820 [Bradymonadia bacterium]|jgi:hypothetical protein